MSRMSLRMHYVVANLNPLLMKKVIGFICLLIIVQGCNNQKTKTTSVKPDSLRQSGEFTIYDNGLIYSEFTMAKLGHVVDSLNLHFETCDPKNYRSLQQGYAAFVSIEKNLDSVRDAIQHNMKLADFLNMFKDAKIQNNLFVVKEQDYSTGEICYTSAGDTYEYICVPAKAENENTKGWILGDSEDRIEAFYLYNLESVSMPEEYARLIQYVDCMIDTTATIFPEQEKPDSTSWTFAPGSKVKEFYNLAMNFEPEPKEPVVDINDSLIADIYAKYDRNLKNWNERRIAALDKKMKSAKNIQLLNAAIAESIEKQNGFLVDFYAERYVSAAKALEVMRSYRVIGFCGADMGPRNHARDICRLAAENYKWNIFLRAHLDILNDNFERASDGNYAKSSRETYIKELEQLKINTIYLLIGTCLKSRDVHENHYQASTRRTGRAIAESENRIAAEDLLLKMVRDTCLDLYNRIEMAEMFKSYNNQLRDDKLYQLNVARLKEAIRTFPDETEGRYVRLPN
jgi:hypothetical protein